MKKNGKSWKKLSQELGITQATLISWKKNSSAPISKELDEWKEFAARRSLESGGQKTSQADIRIEETTGDDATKFRKLRLQLLAAQTGKEIAVKKMKELELERRSQHLVPLEDAKKLILDKLSFLNSLLETLPVACAGSANPSNPMIAENAIREQTEKIQRALSENL